MAKLVGSDCWLDAGVLAEQAHRAGEGVTIDCRALGGGGDQVEIDPAHSGGGPVLLLLGPPDSQPVDGALVEHDRSGGVVGSLDLASLVAPGLLAGDAQLLGVEVNVSPAQRPSFGRP
ncbi:MAG: hypothetical protein OEW29_15975 [Acidimicrobiia bacterium]|nr:hypothetical protein [Acidimicrobiia bacterium]